MLSYQLTLYQLPIKLCKFPGGNQFDAQLPAHARPAHSQALQVLPAVTRLMMLSYQLTLYQLTIKLCKFPGGSQVAQCDETRNVVWWRHQIIENVKRR